MMWAMPGIVCGPDCAEFGAEFGAGRLGAGWPACWPAWTLIREDFSAAAGCGALGCPGDWLCAVSTAVTLSTPGRLATACAQAWRSGSLCGPSAAGTSMENPTWLPSITMPCIWPAVTTSSVRPSSCMVRKAARTWSFVMAEMLDIRPFQRCLCGAFSARSGCFAELDIIAESRVTGRAPKLSSLTSDLFVEIQAFCAICDVPARFCVRHVARIASVPGVSYNPFTTRQTVRQRAGFLSSAKIITNMSKTQHDTKRNGDGETLTLCKMFDARLSPYVCALSTDNRSLMISHRQVLDPFAAFCCAAEARALGAGVHAGHRF